MSYDTLLFNLYTLCARKTPYALIRDGIAPILALDNALEDVYVLAFHVRNIRGGKGERDAFKVLFYELYTHNPTLAQSLMELIPHYGCWDDLYRMTQEFPTTFCKKALDITEDQLRADTHTEKDVSLCAKWVPRETKYQDLAVLLARRLFPDVVHHNTIMKHYRKYVSSLNKRLGTVETYMCSNTWKDIDPSAVPGGAKKKYKRAFLNMTSTHNMVDEESLKELRRPDDEGRMACRATFQTYKTTQKTEPVEPVLITSYAALREALNHPMYNPVRKRIRAYILDMI